MTVLHDDLLKNNAAWGLVKNGGVAALQVAGAGSRKNSKYFRGVQGDKPKTGGYTTQEWEFKLSITQDVKGHLNEFRCYLGAIMRFEKLEIQSS